MAWLIEAYLEEGKHGPDHPESLNMQNKNDMRRKYRYEREPKMKMDDAEGKSYEARKRDAMKNKLNNSKEADVAGKKGIIHGQDYDEAKEKYIKDRSSSAPDKIEANEKAYNKMRKKKAYSNINDVKDSEGYDKDIAELHGSAKATVKSIRRHDEKKAANESVDMLVEILQ